MFQFKNKYKMSFSLTLMPTELARLKKMFVKHGRKTVFCEKTGISRSTLWIVLKTGVMDSTVYEKMKPVIGELIFQDDDINIF